LEQYKKLISKQQQNVEKGETNDDGRRHNRAGTKSLDGNGTSASLQSQQSAVPRIIL
jgi:hypothetical protein